MKKFYLLGIAALLAAGITSCTKDADTVTTPEGAKPLEEDTTFFASVRVRGTQEMSRAYNPDTDEPGFDKGTDKENNIESIYFIFFDENEKRVATTQVFTENVTDENKDTVGTDTSEGDFYKGVIQIDVKHGSLPPAYVTAFINPITSQSFDINPNFESIYTLSHTTRPKIIDDNGNFAMSKSVYFGDNDVTGEENVKIAATPLVARDKSSDKVHQTLFSSREDAEKALNPDGDPDFDGVVIDIYVERYAAKVSFSFNSSLESDENRTIDVGTHKLTFVPEYWAVNAYESETYIVKSFLNEDTMTGGYASGDSEELSYDDLCASLDWIWNSSTNHRCYWAQTPAYYAKDYPRVADDILDLQETFGANGYALGYYSYNEMKDNASAAINAKARDLRDKTQREMAIYARENTVSGKALRLAYTDPFASPKAAIASIALVGHYMLDGKDVDEIFYTTGNATNGYTLMNKKEALNHLLRTTIQFASTPNGSGQFFDYTNGKFYDENDAEGWAKYFEIIHPGKEARNNTLDEDGSGLVIDSRFVTIQIKASAIQENDDKTLYALLYGEWKPVTMDNLTLVNEQMLYSAGTIQGYQGGKAYFTIPIQHLGYYRSTNENYKNGLTANSKDFDWKEVRSGDFGLVRNHSYSIIVDNIKGLGNGIPNPDEPIVPPTDPEEYFIGARLVVLNWAVVPAQHVDL